MTLAAEFVQEAAAEMRPSPAADKLIAEAQGSAPAGEKSPEMPAGDGGGAATAPGNVPGFDPAIHEVGSDGGPVLNADGTMRRRRGRKPTRGPDGKFKSGDADFADHDDPANWNSSPDTAGPDASASGPVTPANDQQQARAAAMLTAQMIVSIGTMLGGDEFKPLSPAENPAGYDELEQLTSAWEQYYIATGAVQLPPWAGVALATGMYIAPRLSKPKTAGRIKSFFDWLKGLRGRVVGG